MIGKKIHSYEINAHLGKGGMGEVFKATDTMLGRDVALKMLHPQLTIQAQFLDRFKKEARVLAQLLHPNIAVIYNFIEQDGNHFMVMEYVEGDNLDDLLKVHKTLPPEFIVPVFIQVLEGMHHAHKKNIFHRDIKPANIMLTPDETVKLMDFGIAKVAGEQKMTQVNKIVGTVEFMAPELIQGKDASAASDIYATGITLYELVAGKLPFAADTDFSLMQAIMKQKITEPRKFNAAIPKALSDIIMKALEKNPANRFTDARAFQQALISAFPNFKTISLASLRSAAPMTSYTQAAGPATRLEKSTNAAMETREEVWPKPAAALGNFKQHVSENKKLYAIVALLFLFLVIAIAVKNNNSGSGEVAEAKPTEEKTNNNYTETNNPVNNTIVTTPQENNEKVVVPDKEKKEPEKGKEKITEKKDADEIERKDVEEEKEKPVVKKDIFIGSRVEIELYLQNDLSNAAERVDIPVSFSLRSPVVYSGVTIINQGAIAKGVIKLGKMQTDVDIFSITAANGQQIRLKAARGHGRRNEITSKRNYTAIIQPGTRLSF